MTTINIIDQDTAENDKFKIYEGFGYPLYTHKATGKTYNIHSCPKELLEETRSFLREVNKAREARKASAKIVMSQEDKEAMRQHQALMDEMDRADSDY